MNKLILVAVIAVAFIGVLFLTNRFGGNEEGEPFLTPGEVFEVGEEGTEPAASQNYTRLVAQFEGRRIQFDENCQMIPPSVTYKNQTQVMLDNRSAEARTIVIAGSQLNFPPYGYKIVTLRSGVLPYSATITKCDDSVNIGQILIQR